VKVLILGAGGQVGGALTRRRWAPQMQMTALSRAAADIGDPAQIADILASDNWDAVVNAAAYTAVDKAEAEPGQAMRVNGDGPGFLAEQCARRGATLIHLSTDYVFDGAKNGAYRESDPPAPLGVYGASKLAGERAVAERLDRHIILRTSWVFAADDSNFVRTMLRLADAGREIAVVNDQIGCPTPADDIAAAIAAMLSQLRRGPKRWGLYHYCGRPAVSWYDFARRIFDLYRAATGRAVAVKPIGTAGYPTAARRPANSRLDCAKIRRSFGIEQKPWLPGLEAAVRRLVTEAQVVHG
jgi:dTDP-4-dehydrorhamnose reductase